MSTQADHQARKSNLNPPIMSVKRCDQNDDEFTLITDEMIMRALMTLINYRT